MATSEDILNRGANQAKAVAGQAAEQYNNLKGQAAEQYQNLKGQAADQFSHLKDEAVRVADTVKGKMHEGQDYVSEAAHRVRERGTDILANVQDQIEKNPLQAIAIAAGVGVVLGVLLRRR
ncbi:MAG: glycine zipper domain-containing protein [Tepidisphaeraceae bacterium]